MTKPNLPPLLLLLAQDLRLRERMANALEMQGCEVRAVATRAEAVEAATARTFDYAIVDPAGDAAPSAELIESLRMLSPQLQILLFSPQRRSAAAQESMRRAGVIHLQKPADADDVLRALGLKRARGS